MSKLRKVSPKRAFACLLVLFALLTVFTAMAENAAQTEASVAAEEAAPVKYIPLRVTRSGTFLQR